MLTHAISMRNRLTNTSGRNEKLHLVSNLCAERARVRQHKARSLKIAVTKVLVSSYHQRKKTTRLSLRLQHKTKKRNGVGKQEARQGDERERGEEERLESVPSFLKGRQKMKLTYNRCTKACRRRRRSSEKKLEEACI